MYMYVQLCSYIYYIYIIFIYYVPVTSTDA